MLAAQGDLEPGAAAVVGRFFAAVDARCEPHDAPSVASFRAAARSESTLGKLLRALARYAPDISTAAGRALRKEWYRSRGGTASRRAEAGPCGPDIADWPPAWQALYPALKAAPIKESTKKRYLASIARCAEMVWENGLDPRFGFYNGWKLSEAFAALTDPQTGARQVKPVSIAGYLDGLVALGRHGSVPNERLTGLRLVRDDLRDLAQLGEKAKVPRIADIMTKGGFGYIAERIGGLLDAAEGLPDHSARKEQSLQAAALCAVHMNKPARTGDVARWRIGRDLVRTPAGDWRLGWEQEKTGQGTGAGMLWPEVGAVLDRLILGGRPNRFMHLRYRELVGTNWLTLSDHVPSRKWPSVVIKRAIGIPSHDLRTLAADYLRRNDPARAAEVIRTHLGHATAEAGAEYRAEAEGAAACASWRDMRGRIAAGRTTLRPPRRRHEGRPSAGQGTGTLDRS